MTLEYLQFSDQNRLRKVSLDHRSSLNSSMHDHRRWSARENDRMLHEISKRQQNLRKTSPLTRERDSNPECLHDRLMSEIKQRRVLRPIGKAKAIANTRAASIVVLANRSLNSTHSLDTSRKRIRPVKVSFRSTASIANPSRILP